MYSKDAKLKIFMTGDKGYLGAYLVPALQCFGEVHGFSESFEDEDQWDKALEKALPKDVDVIVHAATERMQRHEQNRPDAERIFKSNYYCTKRIAEYADRYNAKLIFTSTCSSIVPFSFYTQAKRCGADFITALLDNYCVLNIFTMYGLEDASNNKKSPIHKLMNGNLPYCFAEWVRDYIHVDDVVRAIIHVIQCDIRGEYDLGTADGISSKEMVDIWRHHRPPEIGLGHPCYPEGYHEVLVARPDKLIPGFKTRIDIRGWLKQQSINLSILKTDEEKSSEPLFYWKPASDR